MCKNTCCFFGHREINETEELKSKLIEIIEKLIVEESVDTFLFGSKSRFNDLCYEIVSKIKEKYPHIKRIYVRAEYPDINEQYTNYLLEVFEDTYYPEHIRNSGKAAYVERNYEMINKSKFCIVYYDEKSTPTTRKSGTKIALDYAIKKGKQITVLPKKTA
ncbi:MAG: SLOG family protein [Acutalibacteraceae bacterium]|nr:SLOG family protein [Acutalibacteraceae bacterium]